MTRLSPWLSIVGPLLAMALGCVRAEFVSVATDAGDVGGATCTNPTTEVPGCQGEGSGICDPVCQSGSCVWCDQKCSLDNIGTPVCTARGSVSIGQTCTISLEGTAQQNDDCRAGGICLTPSVGDPSAYCFTLCRNSIDCPSGVACSARPLGRDGAVAWVCDPEYTTCDPAIVPSCCDPLASDPAVNGCGTGRPCYLVSPDPGGHSRTMCEYATGGKGRGEACQSSRECMEKYVCAPSGAGGSGICQRVCSSSVPCPDKACVFLGSEFGYCPLS